MIRTFNVLALAALIGSATVAYSVKYETILVAEKLKKREAELQREKDIVAVLKAEWQLLNRPARLAALSRPEAGLQPLSARQITRAGDVPIVKPEGDGLAKALDGLLTGSIPVAATPRPAKPPAALSARLGARPAPPATPRPTAGARPQPTPKQPMPKALASASRAAGAPVPLRPPAAVTGTGSEPAKPDLISRALGLIGLGRDNKGRP